MSYVDQKWLNPLANYNCNNSSFGHEIPAFAGIGYVVTFTHFHSTHFTLPSLGFLRRLNPPSPEKREGIMLLFLIRLLFLFGGVCIFWLFLLFS